jgi:hypothetical protein
MKTRTLISTAVLAIVALALTIPAVAQNLGGTGVGIQWRIGLYGPNVRNSGAAVYGIDRTSLAPPTSVNNKTVSTFTVKTITPSLIDGTNMDVFIGPSTNLNEPYGKLAGTINVQGGFGAMVLIGAKVPLVVKGTTVTVIEHQENLAGQVVLQGSF